MKQEKKKETSHSFCKRQAVSLQLCPPFASPDLILGGASLFYSNGGRRSQPEQDVVDERDRQGDEHAKNDSASTKQRAEEKMVSNRAPVSAATGEENL